MSAVWWILVAVSNGSYNYGTVTVVAKFSDQTECKQSAADLTLALGRNINVTCLRAKGIMQ